MKPQQCDTDRLADAIVYLGNELCESRKQRQVEFEWQKSHHGLLTKNDFEKAINKIMATQAELVADLKASKSQLDKLVGDVRSVQSSVDAANAKIVELEAIIAAGGAGITQELIDAVAEVKAAVQIVDDNVPEVPPAPPA